MAIDPADYVAIKNEVSDLLLGGLLPADTAAAAAFGDVTIAGLASPNLRGYAADAIPNVHAVGVGRKVAGGSSTQDLAIRVYVQRKLPRARLAGTEQLPPTIAGLPTDVIESTPARILPPSAVTISASAAACSVSRGHRQRPILAGISAGHQGVAAGTLGFFARSAQRGSPDQVLVVSNNHVFANVNQALHGDALLQPGMADQGKQADKFARLLRFHALQLGASARCGGRPVG